MPIVLTAKLQVHTPPDQFRALRQTQLATVTRSTL